MSLPERPLRIVLTGPECTGKTTLAGELARRLSLPVSEEAARSLAAQRGPLALQDIHDVARLELELEDLAETRAQILRLPAVVHDTDLVSTVAYGRFYYGSCPAWIEQAARARRADLYLLCLPDLPFVPEPAQRGPEDRRAEQLRIFEQVLAELQIVPVPISGQNGARRDQAESAFHHLLQRFRQS